MEAKKDGHNICLGMDLITCRAVDEIFVAWDEEVVGV